MYDVVTEAVVTKDVVTVPGLAEPVFVESPAAEVLVVRPVPSPTEEAKELDVGVMPVVEIPNKESATEVVKQYERVVLFVETHPQVGKEELFVEEVGQVYSVFVMTLCSSFLSASMPHQQGISNIPSPCALERITP
jgi:hypothetical protein